MEGVLALIKSGKIQKLILSGDGISRTNYDETKSMEDYLIAKGISKDILLQDPHGIDTWSSMERAKELCSCDSITLISQPFHTPRAYII